MTSSLGFFGKYLNPILSILLVVAVSVVYLNDGEYRTNGQSGDTDSNQLMPITFLADGDLEFSELLDLNKSLPYAFKVRDGKIYSAYPVLPGLLNVPVYFVAMQLGWDKDLLVERKAHLSLITGSLLTACSVGFFFLALLSLKASRSEAFLFALVFAFGTTAISVASRGIWQHGPALFFITAGLALFLRHNISAKGLAMLFFGLAVASRPPTAVLLAPLVALNLWESRSRITYAGLCGLLFVMPTVVATLYSHATTGGSLPGSLYAISGGWQWGAGPLEGIVGVLLSPGRGIFIYSPIFLLAGFGIARAVKSRDKFMGAIFLGILLYLLVVAFWRMWWGGASFGYRMVSEIAPGALILVLYGLPLWRTSIFVRVFAVGAIFLSIATNFVGARYYPQLTYPGPEQSRIFAWSWNSSENELAACYSELINRIDN